MTEVRFLQVGEIESSLIKYVVAAARYQDQWVFARHKARTTWELPGGHWEAGETADQAMQRELWEETGAISADIRPVCIYSVSKGGQTSYGMLFFAAIHRLDTLPEDYEMSQIMLCDRLPDLLTYPDIVSELFTYVQGWLNQQSNPGELWDVYDENRKLTGRLHRRGEPLGKGEYHLVVHVWMQNSAGQFLLTKRSPNKGFPNMWESTGGSALAGDDSLTAALREVREETGLTLDPSCGKRLFSHRQMDYFRDVWLFRQDFKLEDVVLQPGETVDKMYADQQLIWRMYQEGKLFPYAYLQELFAAIDNQI